MTATRCACIRDDRHPLTVLVRNPQCPAIHEVTLPYRIQVRPKETR